MCILENYCNSRTQCSVVCFNTLKRKTQERKFNIFARYIHAWVLKGTYNINPMSKSFQMSGIDRNIFLRTENYTLLTCFVETRNILQHKFWIVSIIYKSKDWASGWCMWTSNSIKICYPRISNKHINACIYSFFSPLDVALANDANLEAHRF